MAKIGYGRVSSQSQSFDIQVKRLKREGCEKVFTDKFSGKSSNRQGLQDMLSYVRESDEIYVTKLDRLGRNTTDMISIVESLTKKGVHITFLDDGISTRGSMGVMVVTILSAIATAERSRILERCNEGREAAVERGVKMGRKPSIGDAIKDEVKRMVEAGTPKTEVAKFFGISRTKVYQVLAESGVVV